MTRAVDTNFLVRLLVADDTRQVTNAEAFLTQHGGVWVSHIVLVETIWVLKSVYRKTKETLAAVIDSLIENRDITLQKPNLVKLALASYRTSKADFSDCLILETARSEDLLPLGTFDKNLGKLTGTTNLN